MGRLEPRNGKPQPNHGLLKKKMIHLHYYFDYKLISEQEALQLIYSSGIRLNTRKPTWDAFQDAVKEGNTTAVELAKRLRRYDISAPVKPKFKKK